MALQIGYTLSSEEHGPRELVRQARRAEDVGFDFVSISDHFHPWIDRQGHSPFVWGVLGGVANATERLRAGTGVTCPLVRIHPVLVAQAAATIAAMMPGRFFLGLGTGENLNEHITGERWPEVAVRQEMLEEAITVIRLLWSGRLVSHRGEHFTVSNARIYTLPDEPPPIIVAAAGEDAAELAARAGDGLWSTSPDAELVKAFRGAGGSGPRLAQVTVCWAADEASARRTARAWWPNAALRGNLGQELPLPSHFEDAVQHVSEDDVAEVIACGPDPHLHLDRIRRYVDAGFDHVYVHQVGPDQEGFLSFFERELRPRL